MNIEISKREVISISEMKILIIGNGAREHAIANEIVSSGGKVYSVMEHLNPGLKRLSEESLVVPNLSDFNYLDKFEFVDLAIIGPEDPIVNGIADVLEKKEIPTVGPTKDAARLEASKSFTRNLLNEYNVPGNPDYKICTSKEEVEEFVDKHSNNVVVKPDAITGEKGVKIFGKQLHSREEIVNYANELIKKHGKVVLEEKLVGKEFSLHALSDGVGLDLTPIVYQYLRAYENSRGPNTPGMGSYTCADHSLPFLGIRDIGEAFTIMRKTIDALKDKMGKPYRGVLHAQFIKTNEGVKLIEFNVRFGDPEAIHTVKLLTTDIIKLFTGIIDGKMRLPKFKRKASLVAYVAPEGYPNNPIMNRKISIMPGMTCDLFFSQVDARKDGIYTTNHRALALYAEGKTINEARTLLFENLLKIRGPIHFRSDLGKNIEC